MSKRKGTDEPLRDLKRRQLTPDNEPEEGEVTDSPGPSKTVNGYPKSPSDSEGSEDGFSKVPLPFKSKTKAASGASASRGVPINHPVQHERSPHRDIHASPSRVERWRRDDYDHYVQHDRARYPLIRGGYGREDNSWRDRSSYDHYRPDFERDDFGRAPRPSYDRYVPEDSYSNGYRRGSSSRSPSKSPSLASSHNVHRLPRRPSPSPPPYRRRRDDFYSDRTPRYYAADSYEGYGGVNMPSDAYARERELYPNSRLSPRIPLASLPSRPDIETLTHPNAAVSNGKNSRPVINHDSAVDPGQNSWEPSRKDTAHPTPASQNTIVSESQIPQMNLSPMSHEKPAIKMESNLEPQPPVEPPPPIPSEPEPPSELRAQPSAPLTPQPSAKSGQSQGVRMLKATGTTTLRSEEEEFAAYQRIFVGVDKLSDFELLNKLGEGTFGEVHKARRKGTGQLVALKRILMKNETEGVPITALREIRILKRLKHRNIVSIVCIIVQRPQRSGGETSIYMVFPYMDHDLAGLLENSNVTLSVSQIKLYMKHLCEGVGYLHRNKILHRDLKSANLLINNEGCLQIADFGLARPVSHISRHSGKTKEGLQKYTNSVVTRWYRSPELLLGQRKYEGWVDMWGVGCIFAEMFQRRPIMPGTSDLDQLTKIFDLCGSPTEENFPGWSAYDPKAPFPPHWGYFPRRIKDILPPEASADTIAFLDRLLTLDPVQRITAFEALDHDYFWTEPLPADPKSLAKYEPSHEFNRRRHAQPNAPQHSALPAPVQGARFFGQPQSFFPNGTGPQAVGGSRPGGGQANNVPPPPQPPLPQPWRGPPNRPPSQNFIPPPPPPPLPASLPPIHLVPGRPPPLYMMPQPVLPNGLPPPPYATNSLPSRPAFIRSGNDRSLPGRPDWIRNNTRPPQSKPHEELNYG
ncbi:kinase-like domain-containing protein [Cantharellus anzutake]|uniref:kinase-like domain-containing protein n=1 Tax=Cantharellus anzutake TaxID=1750568 RepID=UPI001906B512|nr:kinase-like domain-containing protein [Cantharellus anzutake]KAF8324306.1 kinase-like domain-containing protein [Cantharellus anzutake]